MVFCLGLCGCFRQTNQTRFTNNVEVKTIKWPKIIGPLHTEVNRKTTDVIEISATESSTVCEHPSNSSNNQVRICLIN